MVPRRTLYLSFFLLFSTVALIFLPAAQAQQVVNFFQPVDDTGAAGFLALHNLENTSSTVTLSATDDTGAPALGGDITITLDPEQSFYFSSSDLENGVGAADGAFGDGEGFWHITVSSTGNLDVQHFLWAGGDASVSEVNHAIAQSSENYDVWFFTEDGASAFVTSLRIANRSSTAGTITFSAVDSDGVTLDSTATLSLGAFEAVILTAADLEAGNAGKGLVGTIPTSSGFWKLQLNTTLDLGLFALASSGSGQVSDVSNVVAVPPVPVKVNFFQPVDGSGAAGFLGLHNQNNSSITVTLTATDDMGAAAPGGDVSITLGAEESFYFSSTDIEEGVSGATGSFGDGEGAWHITVKSSGTVSVQHFLWAGGDASVSEVNHSIPHIGGKYDVPFFTEDGASAFVTSLRIANREDSPGRVVFAVTDSNGNDLDNVAELVLEPLEAVTLTVADFEACNADKGLSGTIPTSSGFWKLRLITPLDLGVYALASSGSGQVSDVSNTVQVVGSASNTTLGALSCKPTTAKAARSEGPLDFTYTTDTNAALVLESIAGTFLGRLDINGDGLDDIIVGGNNNNSEVKDPILALQSNGDGTFSNVSSTVFNGSPEAADPHGTQADFNGDGFDDVAVFDAGNTELGQDPVNTGFFGEPATLLLSNGDGTFEVSTELADAINTFQGKPELHVKHALSGDIDGDGDIDIMVESGGGSVQTLSHFYINDGGANFTVDSDNRLKELLLHGGPSVDNRWRYANHLLADLNNDGFVDLISGRLKGTSKNSVFAGV